MADAVDVLIVGASARAAAFSALRAGLRPWCLDLFGDVDLRAVCPTQVATRADYPERLPELLAAAPAAPILYTGALENHPRVLAALARTRPLWGNSADVVRAVRRPETVEDLLGQAGLPCPRVWRGPGPVPPELAGQWLVKPLHGAGGRGVVIWNGDHLRGPVYFQEAIAGEACAAIFVASGVDAALVGVTRQLIGQPWLGASGFHYCGSVGPLSLSTDTRRALERMGSTLARGFGLRGLFGVDLILRDGVPLPVEINPRYTASVEVLELGLGLAALDLHRQGCAGVLPAGPVARPSPWPAAGKAIVFAREARTAPAEWGSLPSRAWLADIPEPGCAIEPGQPILTVLAQAESEPVCLDLLQQCAHNLDQWLAQR